MPQEIIADGIQHNFHRQLAHHWHTIGTLLMCGRGAPTDYDIAFRKGGICATPRTVASNVPFNVFQERAPYCTYSWCPLCSGSVCNANIFGR